MLIPALRCPGRKTTAAGARDDAMRAFRQSEMEKLMFDQLIDGVRKASESSLQMQQEMFKQWTRLFSGPTHEAGVQADWGRNVQKRWVELGVETLHRHRE